MSLSEAEKTDVRRFCGYPAVGSSSAGAGGWQFYQQNGLLEFRISNLSDPELAAIRRYLGTLTVLEVAIPKASANLDTDQASVWTHNKNEVRDRAALFDDWRRRLCSFLGIAPGQSLRAGSIALVI